MGGKRYRVFWSTWAVCIYKLVSYSIILFWYDLSEVRLRGGTRLRKSFFFKSAVCGVKKKIGFVSEFLSGRIDSWVSDWNGLLHAQNENGNCCLFFFFVLFLLFTFKYIFLNTCPRARGRKERISKVSLSSNGEEERIRF